MMHATGAIFEQSSLLSRSDVCRRSTSQPATLRVEPQSLPAIAPAATDSHRSALVRTARKPKGKVERTIGFIRRSFFAGRTFTDITDANAQLKTWLAEINTRRHGTHGEFVHERFAAERPLLIQLRRDMLVIERVVTRTVDAEGAIVYESNHYELPRGFRGRRLTVRDDGRRLRVFDAEALICEHELLNGRALRAKRTHAAEARLRALPPAIVERRALDAYEELIG